MSKCWDSMGSELGGESGVVVKICRETGRGIGKCGTACGGDGPLVEAGTPQQKLKPSLFNYGCCRFH